ncbi:MAG TPA: aspartate/glutamate racemase family protein [Bacillota bacterium]|nr:aspartate/glutamate racemase family protein [Bacillota bacterium]
MKTIGLLGGMSWESTVSYYRIINNEIKARLGGYHSAKCLLYSVDFAEIEACQRANDWDRTAEILGQAAQSLEQGGAEFLVLCTNTMHNVIDQISQHITMPVLHIADATAARVRQTGLSKVGLLGTKYTMEQDFYKSRLIEQGLGVIIPGAADREIVHNIIFDQLCLGSIQDDSRREYLRIIADLVSRGAEGIIMGCTEIGLLVGPDHTQIPLFDTAAIHALQAVDYALSGDSLHR